MKQISGLVINHDNIAIGNYRTLIHDRLKRLFFTPIGEAIGALNKGSRIPEMLHNLNDYSIASNILSEVELLVNVYEPRIELDSIEVKTEETELYSGIIIKIDFYYTGTTIKDTIIVSDVKSR